MGQLLECWIYIYLHLTVQTVNKWPNYSLLDSATGNTVETILLSSLMHVIPFSLVFPSLFPSLLRFCISLPRMSHLRASQQFLIKNSWFQVRATTISESISANGTDSPSHPTVVKTYLHTPPTYIHTCTYTHTQTHMRNSSHDVINILRCKNSVFQSFLSKLCRKHMI